MPPELESLFHDLLALPDRDRQAQLEDLRKTQPELHRELTSLLRAFSRSPGFLEPAEAPLPFDRPTHLGRYEIERELGRGAAGVVYLALDPSLGRQVAIKVLLRSLNAEDAEELRNEARALATVAHPNVAQVYSIETTAPPARPALQLILTMEYVPGTTLAQRLASGPLPLETCLDYGRQIAGALETAHLRKVVHRDLKPQNIRITPEGWVKVLDFGLARGLAQNTERERFPSAGTPGYMSPEQCRGESIDLRSDLWSFGAVLYECLVGAPAIPGRELRDVLAANRRGSVDLSAIQSSIPSRTQALVRSALAPDLASRLDSATTARQVLEEELLRLRATSLLERPGAKGEGAERDDADRQDGSRGDANRPVGNRHNDKRQHDGRPGGDRHAGSRPAEAQLRRGNLPTPLSSFVGRETWMKEARQRLVGHRLVTVTGPGGVGKTRTCIEMAHELESLYAGGIWFVDLAGVTHEYDVPAAVTGALRLRESGADGGASPPVQAIASFFEADAGLLLLDNCEHLVAGVARFLEELLAHRSRLTVLATSRNPLGIVGEEVLVLPPLTLPQLPLPLTPPQLARRQPTLEVKPTMSESVQLFLQRAESRAPGFTVGEGGLATIREICERLDGLPLAIELAAGHARSLPLEETLRRVREGRSLSKPTGVRGRHRSLHDLVAWSYELLEAKEQALLRRMTVFRGGCTLGAIESVCGGWGGIESWEVCDLVARLVEASLVEMVGPARGDSSREDTRYRLLETIRSFAAEQQTWAATDREKPAGAETGSTRVAGVDLGAQPLSSTPTESEATSAQSAYIDYFVGFAGLRGHEKGPSRSPWIARIDPDYANLVRALELSLDTGRSDVVFTLGDLLTYYWFHMGQWRIGETWIGRILGVRAAHQRTGPATDTGSTELAAGHAEPNADHEGMTTGHTERTADHAPSTAGPASTADHEGMTTGRTGPADLAASTTGRTEPTAGAASRQERAAEVRFLAQAGFLFSELRELERSRPLMEEALTLGEELGDPSPLAFVHQVAAIAAWKRSELDVAEARLEQSLHFATLAEDRGAIAAALGNLGVIESTRGRDERALEYYRRHLEESRAMGDPGAVAASLGNIGWCAWGMGDLEEARRAFEETDALLVELRNTPNMAMVRHNLGEVCFGLGRLEEGRDWITSSGELRMEIGDASGLATTIFSFARLAERQSRHELAAALAAAVLETFGERNFIVAPGVSQSVGAWTETLTERIGKDVMARARSLTEGQELGEVFRMAVEGTR